MHSKDPRPPKFYSERQFDFERLKRKVKLELALISAKCYLANYNLQVIINCVR